MAWNEWLIENLDEIVFSKLSRAWRVSATGINEEVENLPQDLTTKTPRESSRNTDSRDESINFDTDEEQGMDEIIALRRNEKVASTAGKNSYWTDKNISEANRKNKFYMGFVNEDHYVYVNDLDGRKPSLADEAVIARGYIAHTGQFTDTGIETNERTLTSEWYAMFRSKYGINEAASSMKARISSVENLIFGKELLETAEGSTSTRRITPPRLNQKLTAQLLGLLARRAISFAPDQEGTWSRLNGDPRFNGGVRNINDFLKILPGLVKNFSVPQANGKAFTEEILVVQGRIWTTLKDKNMSIMDKNCAIIQLVDDSINMALHRNHDKVSSDDTIVKIMSRYTCIRLVWLSRRLSRFIESLNPGGPSTEITFTYKSGYHNQFMSDPNSFTFFPPLETTRGTQRRQEQANCSSLEEPQAGCSGLSRQPPGKKIKLDNDEDQDGE